MLLLPIISAIFTGKEDGRYLLLLLWPISSFLYSFLYWRVARSYENEMVKMLAFSRQNTPAILFHLSIFICGIAIWFLVLFVKDYYFL